MKGKTVLVTGATSGIGVETAADLAGRGAKVVITARDATRGTTTIETIRARTPDADVTVMDLDLVSLGAVRRFAAEFLDRFDALHVLVNNAGAMFDKRRITDDGFEMTFQVNHLSPFLLTNLLLDRIKASAPARIVNVSSSSHRGATLDFDDLQSESGYRGLQVYGKSKLCNVLFTRELVRRLDGKGVTANSLHPGTVRTGITKEGGFLAIGSKIAAPFFLSPKKGAATSIYLAASPDVEGKTGGYYVKSRSIAPSAAAQDDDAARKLWGISEQLVGL